MDMEDREGGLQSNVLIGVPTFKGHDKWLNKFLDYHKDYDVMLVDNTVGTDSYYRKLKKEMGKRDNLVHVERHDWNPQDKWVSYMLGDCWNKTIDYAINQGYDYWHWTAMDIYVEDGGGIQHQKKVLEENKEINILGYPTNIFSLEGPPSVLHDRSLYWDEEKGKLVPSFYTWDEINEAEGIIPVHASIGFTLFDIDVVKECRFHHPEYKGWVHGCDLFYAQEIEDKGYTYWCDTDKRAINYTKKDDDVLKHKREYLEKNTGKLVPMKRISNFLKEGDYNG